MHILHVHIHVKPDQLDAFKAATIENAVKTTSTEPGCARFDVMQQANDPTRFVLIEVYHSVEDAAKHKETQHYNHWREIAEPLLAEARSRVFYTNIFPRDLDY